jgi:hypothetical protein
MENQNNNHQGENTNSGYRLHTLNNDTPSIFIQSIKFSPDNTDFLMLKEIYLKAGGWK